MRAKGELGDFSETCAEHVRCGLKTDSMVTEGAWGKECHSGGLLCVKALISEAA